MKKTKISLILVMVLIISSIMPVITVAFASNDNSDISYIENIVEEEIVEDETVEDETVEDETVEDETVEDETVEDEIEEEIEEEILEDEIVEEEVLEEEILEETSEEDNKFEVSNFEDLKIKIEDFNNGENDMTIVIKEDIAVESTLSITNLDNDLILIGENKYKQVQFRPSNFRGRFLIIGTRGHVGDNTITIENINFNGENETGGIFINDGKVELIDCKFENNLSGSGGAIYNYGELYILGEETIFIDNSALTAYKSSGGAIYNEGYIKIENKKITFRNNKVGANSNSPQTKGGAIYNTGKIDIDSSDVLFLGNKALGKMSEGGAIYNYRNDCNIKISGKSIKFENNYSEGASIYNDLGVIEILGEDINFDTNSQYSIYNIGDMKLNGKQITFIGNSDINGLRNYKTGRLEILGDNVDFKNNNIAISNTADLKINVRSLMFKNNNIAIYNNGGSMLAEANHIGFIENIGVAISNTGKLDLNCINIEFISNSNGVIYSSGNTSCIKIYAKEDIKFIDNDYINGNLINIDKDITLSNRSSVLGTSEYLDLSLKTDTGRIYIIGNRGSDNSKIINSNVTYTFEKGISESTEDVIDFYSSENFGNVIINNKPVIRNEVQDIKPDSAINKRFNDGISDDLVMILNGVGEEDNVMEFNMVVNDKLTKKMLYSKVRNERMNSKITVKADENSSSNAKLNHKGDLENTVNLRNGMYLIVNTKSMEKIDIDGINNPNMSLSGWKYNKDLKTGNNLEHKEIMNIEEFNNNTLYYLNDLIDDINNMPKNRQRNIELADRLIEYFNNEDNSLNNIWKYDDEIVFEALWSESVLGEKIEVRFNAMDGIFEDGSKVKTVEIEKGTKVEKPINPVKEGYVFKEWREKGSNTGFNFNSTIVEGKELEAVWEKEILEEKIEVEFNAMDGTFGDGSKVKTVEIEKGTKVEKPVNPVKEGYVFKEWRERGSNTGFNFNSTIVEGKELEAVWEKEILEEKIEVRFNAMDGTFGDGSKVKTVEIEKGTKVEKPVNPVKEGYVFKEWREKGSNTGFNFNSSIVEGKELEAIWDLKNDVKPPVIDNDNSNQDNDSNISYVVRPREDSKESKEELPKDELAVIENLSIEDKLDLKVAYLNGYEDGSIRPEKLITREEAASILYRLLDEDYKKEIYSNKNIYTDVEEGRWSHDAISTLNNANIIKGYPDNEFKPNANITRAEAIVMISRFDELKSDGEDKFKDIEGHWANEYINSSAINGWIIGENGDFRPDDYITRAEFVAIINRVLGRDNKLYAKIAVKKEFTDLDENKWYYKDIQLAVNKH